jgi:N-methylhydantoinase A
MSDGVRIGIDTGGTFTDLVVMDESTGEVAVVKRPSTPGDPSEAILEALVRSEVRPEAIETLVLGTTVAVNALLQRTGARVIYVATDGLQDVPFLQRVSRKFHYDLSWERPLPLVRRSDCLGVAERVDYLGRVVDPLEPAALEKLSADLRERLAEDPEEDVTVAVNFLFSYVRPEHERIVREHLAAEFPQLLVSVSNEVAPIWREYERASTTLADAYVRPLVARFVARMQDKLRDFGFAKPWALMKSNGGQLLAESAAQRPVHTLLSGLSGGVIAGQHYGELLGDKDVITFDMGGTSADVGVVADGHIGYTTEWELEFSLPVSAPFIEMTTMGAGGGSIAWIDKGGFLKVGPQSAGAEPGPACYGLGGTEPTITDANVVLGRLNAGNFLGGEMKLDAERAQAAVAGIAQRLGIAPERAAQAIIEVANENVAEAMRQLTVRQGLDPRDFTLVAFGGAGPLHAAAIARAVGARRVIVPPHPGLSSAFGTLLADMRVDKTWTHIVRSDGIDAAAIDTRMAELVEEAIAELREEGFGGEPAVRRSSNMRYLGQNYEEEIDMPPGKIDDAAMAALVESFHAHHEATYGYRIAGEVIEIVRFNVTVGGAASRPTLPKLEAGPAAEPRAFREVIFPDAGAVRCPIFQREDLRPGQVLAGPAVIEELDSTTLVHPGDRLTVSERGLALIEFGDAPEMATAAAVEAKAGSR